MEKMLPRIIGEDIALKTSLNADVGNVTADPHQLEQVILNLIVNARDAMPMGGKLTIETANVYLDKTFARAHVSVEPGHYVMLAVSDTGSGIDEETQKYIFEPFFTTKETGKGTGLGLSTVYGIVKQSGGNIWVYSEVDKGTTFKIYLPRMAASEEAQILETMAEAPGGWETILLVEDAEAVRTLVRQVLETSGYHVLEAANGSAALLLEQHYAEEVHLLLTDVVMPDMSGKDLADRLITVHPYMSVLYMSGYTDDAIIHHGVLSPGTNFMQKPFTPSALITKVREILNSRQNSRSQQPATI
jgi:CheY-like chemotaxis protein